MIKTATMFTYELDDAERSLDELKEQLQRQMPLMKNTVGILVCDPEFVKTGVVKTVCARLPFPIAGATSMAQSTGGETGRLMLTLMVLTSDDVFFAVGVSKADKKENTFDDAGRSYKEAASRLGAKPEMVLLFTPFDLEIPGNFYVDAFSRLCPDTPVFGSFAMDDLPKFADCLTIMNGSAYRDAVSFVLIGGNVAPRFFTATIPEEKLARYRGKITKASGNLLMQVNGECALKYFEGHGLAKDGQLAPGLRFLPLVMDREKREGANEELIRNEVSYFDQSGFAVCGAVLGAHSTFEAVVFASEYILGTSKSMIKKINAEPGIQALLMFSCIVRRLSLREEPLKELYLIAETVSEDTPYMISYTGGEICPVPIAGDKLKNCFHSYALIACIL
ncbi:MAG: FIST C-terminal domain-containing protein [Acidaminococcales bacterium]|jgi:hypothetical protein|nr:FIST C-terminal domain-containing protein [Acidaminococcales bacterium]